MGRNSGIGRYSRSTRFERERRARLRILKWIEESGELSTTIKMQIKSGTKKKKKAGRPRKVKEIPVEELSKEEGRENLWDTKNITQVKVEFETAEEMEERLAYEKHVKIEYITTEVPIKEEPVDEEY